MLWCLACTAPAVRAAAELRVVNGDFSDTAGLIRGEAFRPLAIGRYTPGTDHVLVARGVPAGTPLTIVFQAAAGGPGLDNVALHFRPSAVAAGLPGVHVNAVAWGRPILPGERAPSDPATLVRDLGFDSVTSYVWIHHVPLPEQATDYDFVRDGYLWYWGEAERRYAVPFFPNVTMGWGSSARARVWSRSTAGTNGPRGATSSPTPCMAWRISRRCVPCSEGVHVPRESC
jgi:hypothetical protein